MAYNINYVGSNPQDFTTMPMAVGTSYSLSIPTGDTAALVTPTYSLTANLTNMTGFIPVINLELQALGLSYGGIGVQHLVDLGFPIPFGNSSTVNFFNQNFGLQGWNSFTGNQFEITASNQTFATPEPGTLFLFGAGLLLLGGVLRRCNGVNAVGHGD